MCKVCRAMVRYNLSSSFLLRKSCTLYNRRESKIVTTLTSLFTASYVMLWPRYFPSTPLKYAPSFDGRIVLYPSATEVRDYFAWRQTDSEHPWLLPRSSIQTTHLVSPHQQSVQHRLLGPRSARRSDNCPGTRNLACMAF